MAEVEIKVGGRAYRVGCDDGQEAHLEALAARLDAEASQLSAGGAHIPESRLLLMTALMVADRLDETEAELRAAATAPPAAAPQPAEAPDAGDLFSRQEGDDAVAAINRAVVRLKAVQTSSSPNVAQAALETPSQEEETQADAEAEAADETGDADAPQSAPAATDSEAQDNKPMSREEMRAQRRARRARMAAGGGD